MSTTISYRLCAVVDRCGSVARGGVRALAGSGAPMLRGSLAPLAIACSVLAVAAEPALADSCPNAQLRTGSSANLPDCRAYEQVSPPDKAHNDVATYPILSTADGNSVAYASTGAFAGSPANGIFNAYAASRSAESWLTTPLDPPLSASFLASTFEDGASSDLTKVLVETNAALTPDSVAGNTNIYVHDMSDGSYRLVLTTADFGLGEIDFAGASADGNRWAFWVDGQLDSSPPPASGVQRNLYEWSSSGLQLVGVLPDGSPSPTGSVDAADGPRFHPVSDDGNRVYWQGVSGGGGASGPVYLRLMAQNQTNVVSRMQSDGSAQDATFWYATPDGSKAFITSRARLTNDASSTGFDLYAYDANSDQLTDLTPDAADANGASVTNVLGVSDDGGYVYFIANGALASGATAGTPNLYVWHDGTTRLIGTLASNSFELSANGGLGTPGTGGGWNVSPNGRFLAFTFNGQITGPHPQDAQPFLQAYLYNFQADSLICASCGGVDQPTGDVTFTAPAGLRPAFDRFHGVTHQVTNDGRMFFDSPDGLVPADTNGKVDVYEYEDGHVSLISSGRDGFDSSFGAATVTGDDVFFITRQSLVGQDSDNNYDVYDARVDGGIAAQNPSPPVAPCSGDACKATPTAPAIAPTAATITFSGPGDIASAPAGVAKLVTKSVRGARFLVKVRVPGNGAIAITGAGIRTTRKSVGKAGTYGLRVVLTANKKRLLAREHKLRLTLRVTYTPAGGSAQTSRVTLMVRPARASRTRHAH